MDDFDFEEDLRIDVKALDIECVAQANLFMKYAREAAAANKAAAAADHHAKIVRSELILQAHSKGEKVLGKGVKASMQTVEAYYRNHPRHIKARDALAEAQFESSVLDGAMRAFLQRQRMLDNLVRLEAQQYFAGPSIPRDLNKEWNMYEQGRAKQRRAAVDKMKSTSRRRK